MPKITFSHVINISVEEFLEACSPTELHEADILMQRPRYRSRMEAGISKPKRPNDWYLESPTTNSEEE